MRFRLTPAMRWGALLVAAIALGLLAEPPGTPTGAPGRMLPRVPSPPPTFGAFLDFLGVGSVVWYAAIVALPLLLWWAQRLDFQRNGRVRTLGAIVVVGVTLMAITGVLQYVLVYGTDGMGPGARSYFPVALRQTLLPWIAVAGIVAAAEGRRRTLRAAVEGERLRAQVAEQRLLALTGQLQPHFLFNTLQGISTLIHRDPQAADEMLLKLSDLLHDLLRHRDQALVSLGDEVGYARTYLEISQLRFGDRLEVAIDAPPALDRGLVPLFVLQPLVENALAHGIGQRIRGGTVSITVTRHASRLLLRVEDDGVGVPATGLIERVGLRNTRERLRAVFGDDQQLTIAPVPSGGTVVTVDIPWQTHAG